MKNFHIKLAYILEQKGTQETLQKALSLKKQPRLSTVYNFRDLALTATDVKLIAACMASEQPMITSLSFSYNAIGDKGACILSKQLPNSLIELGLVDCAITDEGGQSILHSIKQLPKLAMLCIEQNSFSEPLKKAYRAFSAAHPHIVVVV